MGDTVRRPCTQTGRNGRRIPLRKSLLSRPPGTHPASCYGTSHQSLIPRLIALSALGACAPAPLTQARCARARWSHDALRVAAPRSRCCAGSAGYNGRSGETNAADVAIYLRNQAAERGGDTLVITSQQVGSGDGGDSLSTPRGARHERRLSQSVTSDDGERVPLPRIRPRQHRRTAAPAPAPFGRGGPSPSRRRRLTRRSPRPPRGAKRCHAGGGPTGERLMVRVIVLPGRVDRRLRRGGGGALRWTAPAAVCNARKVWNAQRCRRSRASPGR